jgi:ABC-type antimicrobial peptide transport system permease subunit
VEGLDRFLEGEKFTEAVLSWREGVDPEEAERRLELPHPEALLYARPEPPGEVANLGDVDALPPLLAVFLAVLAVGAVAHAVVMSIRRRRRELAVLRALGFTRRQAAGTVSWQATALVVVGLVGGVPLGMALGRWTWAAVAGRMGAAPDPAWPIMALLVLFPTAVALGLIVAWQPGRRAAETYPAAALRTE